MWAQDHIKDLEREREQAVKALKTQVDGQTKTNVYFDDHACIGQNLQTGQRGGGPTFVRTYIQSKRVLFALPRSEMELEVYVNEADHRVEFRAPRGYPYIEPHGNNLFHLVPKEDMYLTPNAVTLCQAACEADKLSHDAFVRKFGFSQEALKEKMKSVVPERNWRRSVHG
jgi:hypothetical protein